MAQFFRIHPQNPQPRLIRHAAEIIHDGGVIAYPTDSCYALGCRVGDHEAATRIRTIRKVNEGHHFTLMCRNLAEIGGYAHINNAQHRLIKAITPGSYTFILMANKKLPRRILHVKRKTIGLRIPAHSIAQALLAELNEPLLSTSLILPGHALPLTDAYEIRERLEHKVDLVIEGNSCGVEMTTVIDFTGEDPILIRKGRGDLSTLGVQMVSRPIEQTY